MSGLEVAGARLRYAGPPPVDALRGADLSAPAGCLTAVVGPSGCGKTTLLRVLAGVERPDAGTVRADDRVLAGPGTHVPPEARAITLVPQEGALFPHLDVGGNVGFGLAAAPRRERRARVEELLELVGLPGAARRRPAELSGGQQQRVALARALAPRPRAVLLDEPFSALDATLRGGLREEVAGLLRAAGTTAVLVTHDRDEALSLADTVAVMHEGRVLQAGTPTEVYRCPGSAFVARLLGEAVVLPADVAGPVATCALGRVPLASAPPGASRVVVRPEQLVPDPTGAGVAAVVTGVRFRGPDVTVTLRVGGTEVTARWPSTESAAPGDTVALGVRGPVVAVV